MVNSTKIECLNGDLNGLGLIAHMPSSVRNNSVAQKLARQADALLNRKALPGEACPQCGSRLNTDGACPVCSFDRHNSAECPDCGCRQNQITMKNGLCPYCWLEKELVLNAVFSEEN